MVLLLLILILVIDINIANSFINHKVYSRKSILYSAVKPFSEEWARQRGMEPGYGGILYH